MRPDDLTALIVRALLEKVPELDPHSIEDLILGCGQPAGESGFNIARVVAVLAGLEDVPGVTVNRYCSSSLQTIRMAAHAIRSGEGDIFLAAGVETVSRFGSGASDSGHNMNPLFHDALERTKDRSAKYTEPWTPEPGLPDVYIAMGQTAENVAEFERVSREAMDEFALRSQELAVAHQENGFFEREIIPVTLPDGTVVTKDDGPRAGTTLEKLASLQPVFQRRRHRDRRQCLSAQRRCGRGHCHERHPRQGARHHAARAHRRQRRQRANPEIMGLGPIEACRQALAARGMTIDDIDLVEINEAFAAQVIPSAKHLGIPLDKLNIRGGAIALGHPFGMTGARIMTTLLNSLEDADKRFGLETMCVGGGQGMAMIVERLV